MRTPSDFIRRLPKAELHLHIEGTFEPELMFAIARRNKVPIPYKTVTEARQAYQFQNLQSFLDVYYQSCRVLIHEQDFYELTWDYLKRAHLDNVRHVELFFDPQSHTNRGISFDTVINGIHGAIQEARKELGISASVIMSFLRHLSADSAMSSLEESLKYKDWISGVGLDSSELLNPPSKFAQVFDRARAEGFNSVAHAGEEGPPEYIWEALDVLRVSRIDHGVRAIEDPALLERLGEDRIPLTVCPLSNLKLRVVEDMCEHPIKQLLDLDLCVTVNSDDPAYFGGYVADNFLAIEQALNLSHSEIIQLARNSFEASHLTPEQKQAYHFEIDAIASGADRPSVE